MNISRRRFLQGCATSVGLSLFPMPLFGRAARSALPVLMFHKIVDAPRYPEDMSSSQCATLLDFLWRNNFCPVNMSDILDNKVDEIVPAGLKAVGITADDAHRSVVFSRAMSKHEEQGNAHSFTDILRDSLLPFGRAPRATYFLSGVGDDRYAKNVGGYFGGYKALPQVLDLLAALPGIECGYHTCAHKSMKGAGAEQVEAALEEQIRDFKKLGVLDRTVRILAYPYGVRPTEAGINQLETMGFKGAVLAYPGVRESIYDAVPACEYDGQLVTDRFLIPRVCIGAFTYRYKKSPQSSPYVPIDPLDDFRKDVLDALPDSYVSCGVQRR